MYFSFTYAPSSSIGHSSHVACSQNRFASTSRTPRSNCGRFVTATTLVSHTPHSPPASRPDPVRRMLKSRQGPRKAQRTTVGQSTWLTHLHNQLPLVGTFFLNFYFKSKPPLIGIEHFLQWLVSHCVSEVTECNAKMAISRLLRCGLPLRVEAASGEISCGGTITPSLRVLTGPGGQKSALSRGVMVTAHYSFICLLSHHAVSS